MSFSLRQRILTPSLFALLLTFTATVAFAQPPQRQFTPEQQAQLKAQQEATRRDHQQMLQQLKITALRPGANPNDPDAPNAVNYDEAKANPYPKLPDPLVLKNGRRVTSAQMWWSRRRAEIAEDFDCEVYGRVPKNVPAVKWEIVSTIKEERVGFPVVTKQIVGHVDNSSYPEITVDIQLTLTTPAQALGPVPVMLELSFVLPRPATAAAANRPALPEPTWQKELFSRGWGFASLIPTSIQADNGAGLTKGIIGLVNKGQPRKPDDWGALRAWAWGASRALDYLEIDPAVDAKHVGIEGLSRYGKAALVAMAYDQRFAIGFIGSSGEGGAKLHRRNFGELVENLTGAGEYHWMAGNFLKYGGPLTANGLPVDAHELIALCAPRPIFISYGAAEGPGAEGKWLDQRGSFMAAVAAGPVYRLLGKKDLGTTAFPPVGTALIDGDIAWRQHSGGHTVVPNWPTFLTFASRYIKGAALSNSQQSANGLSQPKKSGSPEENLPPHIIRLTGFGERAAWSPDGRRIAFMSKSYGDAFEIDLETRMIRLLTGHFLHKGFLRVQYLPNGDFFLIGARTFEDISTTRARDQEMWVMRADAKEPPVPLGHKISEGVAISRRQLKIAWANTHGQYPDLLSPGESVLYTADIVYKNGVPTLENKQEVVRSKSPECTLEAQDFRRDDTELIYVCYRAPHFADVMGVDLNTRKVTVYRRVEGEYNEVEGIYPDGEYALVESSREQGGPERQNSKYIDLWRLRLVPHSTDFVRMTRWGDYEGYKASNPVVSPDGRWFAFQSARSKDPAGVGYGIFLYKLKEP